MGGPVIGDTYDGSQRSVEQVRANVENRRSRTIGQPITNQHNISLLLEADPQPENQSIITSSRRISKNTKEYQSNTIKIHITGFAKVVGDLIAGLEYFILFFVAAILIDAGLRFGICDVYAAPCWSCSHCGDLATGDFTYWFRTGPLFDPGPFLIFSIGMSHGSQKLNGILQISGGHPPGCRGLLHLPPAFPAGMTALLCDAVGFVVFMIIQIRVIQELALWRHRVAILIFTNLILCPSRWLHR
jgi:hypothetical protein